MRKAKLILTTVGLFLGLLSFGQTHEEPKKKVEPKEKAPNTGTNDIKKKPIKRAPHTGTGAFPNLVYPVFTAQMGL